MREAIVAAVVCTLSDSAGPVELKRATLGSEDRPRVGGGPGVGSQGWPCSYHDNDLILTPIISSQSG